MVAASVVLIVIGGGAIANLALGKDWAREARPVEQHAAPVSSSTPATTTTAQVPDRTAGGPPPARSASVASVIAWIEAAAPADPAYFHTVEEDGTFTTLHDAIAFRPPGDLPSHFVTGCVIYSRSIYNRSEWQLSCLGGVNNPPPKPPGITGQWIGSWVDFDGKTVDIGSLHGDPGPFNNGNGRPLPYGARIQYGDYQCRSDPSGLHCANYSQHSAIRLWGKEVIAYGCTNLDKPRRGIGRQYDC